MKSNKGFIWITHDEHLQSGKFNQLFRKSFVSYSIRPKETKDLVSD